VTYVQWGVRGISLFALGLGALGVLNVGIVTVRQRVREIGVRRALGASSGRVFAAVMLESVCATALAGALGVAAAVAVVVNLPLELVYGELGISEVPPFPVSAAVEAFVAATAVGALVGLVPATMAVRARVIDAIRY
jgi:putative ABC transport system permease protein